LAEEEEEVKEMNQKRRVHQEIQSRYTPGAKQYIED